MSVVKFLLWLLASFVLAVAGDPAAVPQVMSSSDGWFIVDGF